MVTTKKQHGFLLLAIIIIITIVAIVATSLVFIFVSSSHTKYRHSASKQALYAAESGIEYGVANLVTTSIDNRINCNNLNTTKNIGFADFQLTSTANSPYYPTALYLTSTISATDTNITLSSTSGLAPRGRLMLDHEAINYSGLNGNQLLGVERGADNTFKTAHAAYSRVAQYQCDLNATSYVPSMLHTDASKTLTSNVQLQEMWSVGGYWWSQPRFARFNSRSNPNSWSIFTDLSSGLRARPRAISMLNYVDGWVVGDAANSEFSIWRRAPATNINYDDWNKLSMSTILFPKDEKDAGGSPLAAYITNLTGVSAVSTNDIWAVGERANPGGAPQARYTVMHFNGSNWCLLDPYGLPSDPDHLSCTTMTIPADSDTNVSNLNAVAVIRDNAGDFGFAVGDDNTILVFSGGSWSKFNLSGLSGNWNFYGVYILDRDHAWVVGGQSNFSGIILYWNGSTWSVQNYANAQLNSIYMLDQNEGYTVGSRLISGLILHYTQSQGWRVVNPPGYDLRFWDVKAFNSNDVWIVGGIIINEILHFDGNSWDKDWAIGWAPTALGITGHKKIPQATYAETII